MFQMFMISICLQSVPYGNSSDLVANKFIESTKISTGLFYSIHLPEYENQLVSFKIQNIDGSQCPVLVGSGVSYWSNHHVPDSNLFVFHPSHVGNTVKMFHKEKLATIVLAHTYNYQRYIMMKNSNFNYHLVRSGYSSRLSSSEKEEFMRHCKDSSFKLKKTSRLYYELLNHDESEAVVYNTDSKEFYSKPSSYNNPTLLKLVPQRYKLRAVITDFSYDNFVYSDLDSLAIEVPSVQKWNFTNESYETVDSHVVHIKEAVTNTMEISFSNGETKNKIEQYGWNVGVKASFNVAEGVGIGGNAGGDGTYSWSSTNTSLSENNMVVVGETSFSLTSTITVNPRQATHFMLVWKKVDIELAFTATVRNYGVADRLNKDGSVSKMVAVDPEGVEAIMLHQGFNFSRVGNDIVTYISGSVRVKKATKGQTRRHDKSLDETPGTGRGQ